MRRVVRPGGELRDYEHVVDERPRAAALQRRLDGLGVWPRIAGGCHPARDTGAAIARAGFQIHSREELMFAASRLEPSIPHILGVARRP
jgi:hypothetical protein